MAGRRVLVVEDDWLLASEIVRVLEAARCVVIGPAPSVPLALAHVESGQAIDAALLDINLQGQLSYEVADLLLARGVRFAFVTGYPKTMLPRRFGEVPLYEKPFEPRRVLGGLLADDAETA
ncbi:MAG: hypothetical protein C0481_03830 [Phenylobacterium sp.]|nr:hypothetical protein [Phenylobacterium sp.]